MALAVALSVGLPSMTFAAAPAAGSAAAAGMRVVGLRTEYKENPLGIDAPRPRLGWKLQSEHPGEPEVSHGSENDADGSVAQIATAAEGDCDNDEEPGRNENESQALEEQPVEEKTKGDEPKGLPIGRLVFAHDLTARRPRPGRPCQICANEHETAGNREGKRLRADARIGRRDLHARGVADNYGSKGQKPEANRQAGS